MTDTIKNAIKQAQANLNLADPTDPAAALPLLRSAQDHLTTAIDEAMAATILESRETLRSTAALAGLSENAVGPRLARTSLLGAYENSGRVTAAGVERARYDAEEGRLKTPEEPPAPMRFRARRSD